MFLVWLLFIAALSLEGIGTYISVIGLSAAFAADPIILTMAVVLDFCKIIAVSTLSKRWREINLAIRGYLIIATIVLMVITSSGIAGYLSNSFQKALLPNQGNTIVLDNLNKEHDRLAVRKKEIDTQIAQLPTNSITGRKRLMTSFKPETDHINKRLNEIDTLLPTLQTKQIVQNTEVGPILFLAESLNTTPEKAVSLVIMMIIFVFDPLSIIFLITANQLMTFRDKLKQKKELQTTELTVPLPVPPTNEVIDVVIPEVKEVVEEHIAIVQHQEEPDVIPEVEKLETITEDLISNFAPSVSKETPVETLSEYDPPFTDAEYQFFDLDKSPVEEIIHPPIYQPKDDVKHEDLLEDILKQIAKNKNGTLSDEEQQQLDRALDRIFASGPQQETSDEPDHEPEIEVMQPQEPITLDVPSEPADVLIDDDEVQYSALELEEPEPVVTSEEALHDLVVHEDLTVPDFDNTKVIDPAPKFINSLLLDPSLNSIHGADFDFVGPHWIDPKLLEIYNTPKSE